ncbi:piggyBac transposable element-derived protein 4-like [Electrophorus electricus]|uniref:piggyBac transposable element-derived protein 4-like n=1 Tax=Electrophorus electricus TaxID=8005 RepID=UPI0015D0C2D8|nr:piggyBac transposable element-derived protein 4-like [Electrophorus electricus]
MERKRLTLAEVDENLFRFSDEESESDDASMAASMDSEEEVAFVHGIDAVLDMPEVDPPYPPPHGMFHTSSDPLPGQQSTSTLSSDKGSRSTSPPHAKTVVPIPSAPIPSNTSHTVAGQQPLARARKRRSAPGGKSTASPPPTAQEDRWHDTSEEDEQPPPLTFCPRRNPGVQLDFQTVYSPSDIFQLFFSQEVIQTLCNNTNGFAAQRKGNDTKRPWTDVNADEMLHYLSIIIYLGLMKPSAIGDLWRKDHLHSYPFPPSVMAGKRYKAISAYLHMSDPAADAVNDQLQGQPGYDGLFRIKPLQEQILTACQAYYHPHQNIAVDERIVATEVRHRVTDKPPRRGGNARKRSGKGLSFDAVVDLIDVPSLGTGYTVYVDSFYTSSLLFRHLRGIGFGACGTIRETRICFPRTSANALPRKADRGDMRWIRDGPLLFVKWKDIRDVTVCSTAHKAYSGKSMQCQVRSPSGAWCTQQIPVPDPVWAYNTFMGEVDWSDALIKYFSPTQKTRRWFVQLFLQFIDIAVMNSFIIHKEMALARQQKPLNQKRFREVLCLELAGAGQPQESSQAEAVSACSSLPHVREQRPEGCFPVPVCQVSTDVRQKASHGRRKCVYCKKRTMLMCKSCNVPLCINVKQICFTKWHVQKYA